MKLWRFYKKPDKSNKSFINYTEDDVYLKIPLLAITNKEKYAKKYMKSRNMNKIICNIDDDIEDEEIIEYMRRNRGNVLDYKDIKTFKNKNKINQEEIVVKVLMTENEYNNVADMIDSGYIFSIRPEILAINPLIFNDKIRKILASIDYVDAYALYHQKSDVMQIKKNDDDIDGDYPSLDWDYDMFAIFLMVYEDMIDKKGFYDTIKF